MTTWTCNACEGVGCDECERTGQRFSLVLDLGDGTAMRLSGVGPEPVGDTLADLRAVAVAMRGLGVLAGQRRPTT